MPRGMPSIDPIPDPDPDPAARDPLGATSFDVGKAATGDAAATDRLVRRLEPLLLADARYRLRRTGLADVEPGDVVAEAWAVALPLIGRIGEDSPRRTPALLAFLATTMRNVVGGLLRRRDVRGTPKSLDANASTAGPPEPATTSSGVVTRVARAERKDLVLQALDRLEEIDREILMLKGVEQRGNAEVAGLLGIAPTTAAMRYRRALDRLREELPGAVFNDLADD